jgi:colanic acid biosynthesis glycosyl transferase WcaI
MHVTIVTDRYAPEARAAAYLSRELAEGLARLGHRVVVLTRMPTHFVPDGHTGIPQARETQNGVSVKRFSGITASSKIWLRALDQLIVTLKLILTLWTSPKSDVLLVYSPPMILSLAAVVQRWVRRWPFVLNLHDIYPQTAIDLGILRNPVLIWVASLFERVLYRNATRIVVAAPSSLRILTTQKGISPNRVEMLFNYIDTTVCKPGPCENAFRKRLGIEGKFVVLYAGLMGLAQDLGSVIEAARRMQHDPQWVFVLAGNGPCAAKWAELTSGLSNVKMPGVLNYDEYNEALQAADVCLVALAASFHAPAVPGKVPTIMAAGRPIVACVPAGNDTRDILHSARCGIAVLPEHTDDLLEVLETLQEDSTLRSELGSNGAQYAAAHFDARAAVARFEIILSEIHAASGGQRLTAKAAGSPDLS